MAITPLLCLFIIILNNWEVNKFLLVAPLLYIFCSQNEACTNSFSEQIRKIIKSETANEKWNFD